MSRDIFGHDRSRGDQRPLPHFDTSEDHRPRSYRCATSHRHTSRFPVGCRLEGSVGVDRPGKRVIGEYDRRADEHPIVENGGCIHKGIVLDLAVVPDPDASVDIGATTDNAALPYHRILADLSQMPDMRRIGNPGALIDICGFRFHQRLHSTVPVASWQDRGRIQESVDMPIVMNVVGARPQFVKAGPVSRALVESGVEELLVHTGQHYDDLMSDSIMADVGLRPADINLNVGSESHGVQTARILEGIEAVIFERRPDAVITYGDTNSTIAAALAAVKVGVFTGHVEAGLRSFNRAMPEEHNRIATDHLSDILLAPTEIAMGHLANEGLTDRSILTGDVMVDALLSIPLDRVAIPNWAEGQFYAATLHRPSNTDEPERLRSILEAMGDLDLPVHLLAHPRLQQRIKDFGLDSDMGSLHRHDPLPYSAMLATVSVSRGLLTDSGGLQKEAFVLGIPCTTIRSETEWPETLVGGWNVLAGSALDQLPQFVSRLPAEDRAAPFGDGNAAKRIVSEVLTQIN